MGIRTRRGRGGEDEGRGPLGQGSLGDFQPSCLFLQPLLPYLIVNIYIRDGDVIPDGDFVVALQVGSHCMHENIAAIQRAPTRAYTGSFLDRSACEGDASPSPLRPFP